MATKQGDGPELSSLEIQDLAEQLDISSPIMSYRVVGERVELHLLGGGVAIGRLGEKLNDVQPAIYIYLDDLSVRDLRKIAQAVKIPGAKRLRKAELLAALSTVDHNTLSSALEEVSLPS